MAKKTVVAAVDDTQESQQVVEWLERFLPPQDELRLVMCVPEQHSAYSAYSAGVSASHTPHKGGSGEMGRRQQWLTEAEVPPGSQLQAAQAACQARFPHQAAEVVAVPSGSSEAIGASILEQARALHASLLAIAPHARSATQRVLHGSVTDYCCKHSHLPVLVVQGVAGGSGGRSPPA